MVARRDKHRHADLPQRTDEFLARLVKGVLAVEQVAGEEYDVGPLLRGQSGDAAEQVSLLAAADRGLGRPEPLKGRVHVQVGRVQDAQPSHVSLTPSAERQRPVSGSISKRQPSSLAGPFPAS